MSDDVKVINAPERIYLQVGDDFLPGEADFETLEGVTWCADNIHSTDVAYVRADLLEVANARIAELESAQSSQQGAETFVLRALVAAGHVSHAKVDEAFAIAANTPGVATFTRATESQQGAVDLTAMNNALCDFSRRWLVDGDYLRCRKCKRPHIASKADEPFAHDYSCKRKGEYESHPWRTLVSILGPLGALTQSPDSDRIRREALEEAAKLVESLKERISAQEIIGFDAWSAGHNALENAAGHLRAMSQAKGGE